MIARDDEFDGMLDLPLRALDKELSRALAAAELSPDRVEAILEACELARALRVETPVGLEERVFEATSDESVGHRPVLARIGPWLRGAAAAAAVVLLAILLIREDALTPSAADHNDFGQTFDLFVSDAAYAGSAIADLESDTLMLATDVEAWGMTVDDSPILFPLDPALDELEQDLWMLEVNEDVF